MPRSSDGRFYNPWPESEPHGLRDVLRFLRERPGGRAPSPPRGSFPTAVPDVVYPRAAAARVSATWIGHSSVLLQVRGVNILTDPMFSQRAFPVQWMGPRRVMDPGLALHDLPPIDIVALSHNHYDHLDATSVRRIARANPDAAWIVPLGVGRYIGRWGPRSVVELDWWQERDLGFARVTGTPARHFSGRGPSDRNRSLWSGFGLEVGGHRTLFVGDRGYHPEFGEIGARCGPFDLVLMPIGAYQPRWFMSRVHMDPDEAVRAYGDVVAAHPAHTPPVMLALHWGTFRLTDEPMEEPPRRARECWRAAGRDESLLWIASFGETRRLS